MPQFDQQVHYTYGTVSFGMAVLVTVLDTCNRSQWRLSKCHTTHLIMLNFINATTETTEDMLSKQQSVSMHKFDYTESKYIIHMNHTSFLYGIYLILAHKNVSNKFMVLIHEVNTYIPKNYCLLAYKAM
jgi:hypothetical protein